MSDNLYILAFNIKITQPFDPTIVEVIDDSHERKKSLMLVIGNESLSQVFVFVFVIPF